MSVGQFLGKLFGGDSGKNEALLRAYGKLPMYAEYRRLEVAPGTPTQFTQWMDAGRLAWVRSPTKTEQAAMRATRLLLRPPEAKEIVVASVWDSRDSLGRIFPFSFFVVCPAEALGRSTLERWVSAISIFDTFERRHAELVSLGHGGDFYRLYRKRTVRIQPENLPERAEKLATDAAGIAADEWFRAALGDGVARSDWFGGVARRAERWKAQPNLLSSLALSCPLAEGISKSLQTVIWVWWVGTAAQPTGRSLSIIAPSDSARGKASMHLLTRDLMPDDFQLLTSDDAGYGFIERLGSGAVAGEGPPIEPPSGSLLDWVSRTLNDNPPTG